MREPYTRLYLHLVWATWDRLPLLVGSVRDAVYASLQAECAALRCDVLALGGTPDHVHLLLRFSPVQAVAAIVKQLKGSSSHLVTHGLAAGQPFRWQGGYGAFTLRREETAACRRYILSQEAHHGSGALEADWERTEQPP